MLFRRCFCLVALSATLFGCQRDIHAPQLRNGDPVIARGMTIAGESLDLGEDYAGKPVLLNVWASWCGPCKMEFPALLKLQRDRGISIVGVNVDSAANTRRALSVKQRFALPFPSFKDPSSRLANRLGATALPTSVLLNAQHKVVWSHQGLLRANNASLGRKLDEIFANGSSK